MKHITEFIATPANLLRVGDVWDELAIEARAAILTLCGKAWIGSSPWKEIPSQFRVEIAHQVYFFRDFINRVLP
jgi:hypothetical protein